MGCFLYRNQEPYLENWLKKTNRKPLVIRGARQVGKSTLVRQFCKQNHIKLHEINLEKYPELDSIFASNEASKVISAIEDILEVKINPSKSSLLFLDEIQSSPAALECLRYFHEELSQLPVIAAGSLLEFLINDHDYSMPVGRIEFLHMGPMTFSEFLTAKKESYFLSRIEKIKSLDEINEGLHNKGIQLLREYMFCGGMPEALQQMALGNIEEVSIIQSQILQAYQSDFVKYSKKSHLQKIQKIFRYVFLNPCQKIKFSNISREDLSRDLKLNLELLEESKVISFVRHSDCAGLPLEASESEKVYKVLTLDVGLMNHAQGLQWRSFKNYQENEIVTEGDIAEQFIGQHLLYQKPCYQAPRLNYWLREGKSENAEVDYVVEEDSQMIAIEVKSGAAGKIRSLHQWQHDIKFKKKKAVRFNLSRGSYEKVRHQIQNRELEYELVTLPLYLIDLWKKFL
jgi:predicted AAA+ superfamily ATPase